MFKFRKSFTWAVLACTALCAGFTSCGTDDDDDDLGKPEDLWKGELADAKYENDAVFYQVLYNPDISSIELTASGNYIVMPHSDGESYAPASRAEQKSHLLALFRSNKKSTRYDDSGDYENAVFGTYTRNSDGSYDLEGFGTLSAYNDGKVTLARNDGQTVTLDVNRKDNMSSDPLDNRLCRTWEVQEVYQEVYAQGGNLIASKKYTGSELREEFVQCVLVSKAGTFTQIDWDGTLDSYGHWWWDNRELQIFNYSFVDESGVGSEGVKFDGNRASFYEQFEDYLDDEDYDFVSTRYGQRVICQIRVVCKAK